MKIIDMEANRVEVARDLLKQHGDELPPMDIPVLRAIMAGKYAGTAEDAEEFLSSVLEELSIRFEEEQL